MRKYPLRWEAGGSVGDPEVMLRACDGREDVIISRRFGIFLVRR